jgi:hypothetical protein
MTERVRALILCEDRQQEVFARYFLEQCGVRPVRVIVGPIGLGSGEQFVRQKYPAEVKVFRRKYRSQPNTRLVVLSDADILEVSQRLVQLEAGLTESQAPRQPDERIAVFIPKRNIETWIHYLMGEVVNEADIYRHLDRESECKGFVEDLARNRRQPLPENAPQSLKTACEELPRIFPEEL